MAKDITPCGINKTVRLPLAQGTIARATLVQRVPIQQMMKAKLADRIAKGGD